MRTLLIAATAAACLVSVSAQAKTMKFHATLDGQQQVPPVQTNGHGTANATLNTATRRLTYTVNYSGLSGPAIAGHLHGPAKPGENARVQVPFKNPSSPIKGSAQLSEAQEKMLENGEMYVNIHTADHKGGEIRGQLEPVK